MDTQLSCRRSVKSGLFKYQLPKTVLFFGCQNIIVVQDVLCSRDDIHCSLICFSASLFLSKKICFGFL